MAIIYAILLVSVVTGIASIVRTHSNQKYLKSEEGQRAIQNCEDRAKSILKADETLIVADALPRGRDFLMLTDKRVYHESKKGKTFSASYGEIRKFKMTNYQGNKTSYPNTAAFIQVIAQSGKLTISHAFPQFERIAQELNKRCGA